jgi:hypothetical protein
VQDVLNSTYHDQWIGRRGSSAWTPRSKPDLSPLDFYLWSRLKFFVCAAPVENEEALHRCIMDACQTIRIYTGFLERTRWSMVRHVEACIESHGGHFEHLL